MDGWTDGLDGWTDGRTDGWMDERTDGRTYECHDTTANVYVHLYGAHSLPISRNMLVAGFWFCFCFWRGWVGGWVLLIDLLKVKNPIKRTGASRGFSPV